MSNTQADIALSYGTIEKRGNELPLSEKIPVISSAITDAAYFCDQFYGIENIELPS